MCSDPSNLGVLLFEDVLLLHSEGLCNFEAFLWFLKFCGLDVGRRNQPTGNHLQLPTTHLIDSWILPTPWQASKPVGRVHECKGTDDDGAAAGPLNKGLSTPIRAVSVPHAARRHICWQRPSPAGHKELMVNVLLWAQLPPSGAD